MPLVPDNNGFRFLSVRIYHNIEEFEKVQNAVVTTGTFDGVHVGHLNIINRLCELAKEKNGK